MIADAVSVPILSPAQWSQIDTVLLDLDGTLLDLAFDSRFWRQRVPEAWAQQRAITLKRVRVLGKRLVLITNAHPITLAIKDARTEVISYFDAGFSSHRFGAPQEHPQFWRELAKVENFDPGRSLFVDDSLGVLRAARAAGLGLIYAVRKPDSSCAARMHQEFPAVDAVAELL
jgi:5'-nucleotidase